MTIDVWGQKITGYIEYVLSKTGRRGIEQVWTRN